MSLHTFQIIWLTSGMLSSMIWIFLIYKSNSRVTIDDIVVSLVIMSLGLLALFMSFFTIYDEYDIGKIILFSKKTTPARKNTTNTDKLPNQKGD